MDWSFWSQYGNYASVAGLLVSVVGFGFTIWQVIKSRKAAEEAKLIASEAINRIRTQLFFTEVTTAIRLIQELRNFSRLKQWHRVIDRCDDVRILLAEFMDDSKLLDEEQQEISLVRDNIIVMIRHIERILDGNEPGTLDTSMAIALDKMVNTLSRINGRMKRLSIEV
ncbi:MAG TPA: hypothetical protein VFC63_10385 [Blastocatellia bacterium]|nr:hypothetical protein [Blastocatellia bacterium]